MASRTVNIIVIIFLDDGETSLESILEASFKSGRVGALSKLKSGLASTLECPLLYGWMSLAFARQSRNKIHLSYLEHF